MRFYNGQHRFYAGIDLPARFLPLFGAACGLQPRKRKKRCRPKGKLDRFRTINASRSRRRIFRIPWCAPLTSEAI